MSDPFLSNLIPDSNRLDISFARHSSNNGVNLLAEAYSKGFVGACKDDPDWPEWARRAARYGLDDFMHNTPGTKKLFSDVESGLPSGDGDRAITCRHAIELWEAGGRTGVKPYSCYQGFGSCFPPGVIIRMADGTSHRIEELSLGQTVVTAEGNTGRVTTLFLRDVDEPIYRIKLWGHYGIRLTGEHPLLTARGYVKASEIQLGDEVALAKYAPSGRVMAIQMAEHSSKLISSYARHYRQQSYRSVSAKGGGRKVIPVCHSVPDVVQLTAEFGRLIGLYLAEGNTEYGKVVWTYSSTESETLVSETVSIIKMSFGIDASVRQGRGSIKVVLHSVPFAQVFESLCGTGSAAKRLHADLTCGPDTFREAILHGWLDGDGYERDRKVQGTTVSKRLALDMFSIATSLGLKPTIRYSECRPGGNVKSRQPRYDVCILSEERGGSWQSRQDERHVWRKVRAIEQEEYAGPVYNFSVEGDQSYLADEISVHNCVDASASEHMTTLFGWRAVQAHLREQYIHPAAWYWYADRGYCSDGWYGGAIAAVALRRGCAFRTKYDLGGNTVDFTDDDLNERIVARTWCKSGIPSWLSDHTSANHPFEDGAITQLDGGLDALKKALAANGAVHCGGTRTSGGSKPFTPGRTGPHMQSAVGYDDSDEYRQWLKDNHSITLPANDFAVIMHQTWGANWNGETGDAYWPTHLWGPKPEGAWVCKATYILGDAEYVWLPRVKGFPSSGPTPVPPAPPLVGKLRAEQAGQVIAIRGEVSIGGNIYIAVPNGDGTYGFIQKPVV